MRCVFLENIQQREVDFVVVRNRNVRDLIPVWWDMKKPAAKLRESGR
ncbi:MAG: hypothetical protein JXA71_19910 [Chitinispirillaceae bacterium]|nr:hypothetical protein [Chitinispirillaceae bacterium]